MSDPSAAIALARARWAMANAILGGDAGIGAELGTVTLHPHQRTAAARIVALVDAHGGALLAEPVGLGKTYVALAVARRYASVLVITPAALRDMWRAALAATGVDASLMTHEGLSRVRRTEAECVAAGTLVIIDEAHRFRTPTTQRYAAAAELCRRAHVLLLTATPIHNRRADVAAQLALYLGRSAWELTSEELAAHAVRETTADRIHGLPVLDGPHRMTLETDDDCLDELVALPPSVPAADEGVAAALVTYSLVHQWASSRAALVAAIKRRLTRAVGLASALADARMPTRSELAAWVYADDTMQLAFPGLVADTRDVEAVDLRQLRAAVERHSDALSALLLRLRGRADPDVERATLLRRIRARHPGERVIAFAQYAETIVALRRGLAREAGVAALTARGAHVAGGRVTRNDLLRQFIPSDGAFAVGRAERIELLLTTDLLSEGLNLQEASVVVHLDLPWNPARLDQRVGRVRRLGGRHEIVFVYAFAPPASADRLLRLEARLREKLCVARETVGIAGRILPSLFSEPAEVGTGASEELGAVHTTLRRWQTSGRENGEFAAGAVASDHSGFVAAVIRGGVATMIVAIGDGDIETHPQSVRVGVEAADGPPLEVDPVALRAAMRRIQSWLADRRGAATIDLGAATAARARREALTRVARALARTPRHRRAVVAPLADAARAVATAHLAEGAERVLDTLVHAELPDEAWLRSIAAFGELNARPTRRPADGDDRVVAVILLNDEKPPTARSAR